jgi:transcriptional regulator with XRE-family HTH domain
MSIRQLAERAQVTPGVISCIERGKNSPSIATLHKILTAMGSDLAAFFSGGNTRQEGPFFRRERMQAVGDGHRQYTIVFTNADGVKVEVFDETIYPADGMPELEKLECHMCGYVLSGSVVLEIGDRPAEALRPGDAFFVARNEIHRGYAVGEEPARLITVHYPIGY